MKTGLFGYSHIRFLMLTLVLFGGALLGGAPAAEAACGGDGQAACTTAKATQSKKKPFCPSGSFWDIGKGACYSCPSGYNRTLAAVTAPNACQKPATTAYKRARDRGGLECKSTKRTCVWTFWGTKCWNTCTSTGCPSGAFWDVGKFKCYTCDGYSRTVHSVTSANACEKVSGPWNAKASYKGKVGCDKGTFFDPRKGGECWSCPAGYDRNANAVTDAAACTARARCAAGNIEIAGKCYKKGACGGNNQRACTAADRNLLAHGSCNPGYKEVLGQGKCIKAKPGEIPFFASIGDAIETTMKGGIKACTQVLGDSLAREKDLSQAISWFPKMGNAPGKCPGYMGIGFVCEAPSIPGAIGGSFQAVANASEILEVGKAIGKRAEDAYWKAPCSEVKDPTLRGLCAAGIFIVGDEFTAGACMVKAVRDGVFGPLKLGTNFSRQQCTAMGKMMFTISWNAFKARMMKNKFAKKWKEHKRKKAHANAKKKAEKQGRTIPDLEDAVEKKNWAAALYGVYSKMTLPATAAKVYGAMSNIPECNANVDDPASKSKPAERPKTISADSDLIFGVQPNGDLLFYEASHNGQWRQTEVAIGNGWTQIFGDKIFTGGPGEFYGINAKGELLYYLYDLKAMKWAVTSKRIGTGWQGFEQVFGGGDGYVYALRKNGELLGYRHDKMQKWVIGGKVFGTGWKGFSRIFPGGGGVLYAIKKNGDLAYYRHDADFNWIVTNKDFGNGWQIVGTAFSGGDGRIYATKSDGALYAYRHDAALKWPLANKKLGTGWTGQFGTTLMAALPSTPPPSAFRPDHGWNRLPGLAIDVGAGADGTVWAVGTDKAAYEWSSGRWIKRPGTPPLKRIDVKGFHEVWAIAENTEIWRSAGGKWQKMPGLALDIGIGGGQVFVVGTDRNPYQWDGKKWNRRPGSGQSTIDVDPNGNIWIVNVSNIIWRWDGKRWIQVNGLKGLDVGIGPSGRVFVVGTDRKGYLWAGGNSWKVNPPSGGQASVTATATGPLIVNSGKQIWQAK